MRSEDRHTGPDQWEARLSDYLDDELTAAERLEVEGHLRACASCRAVLQELRAVVARAAGCERESIPATDLWTGIAPRLAARSPRASWRRALDWLLPSGDGRSWWRSPAFAAACTVLVATAVVLWLRGGGVLQPGDQASEPSQQAAASPAPPAEGLESLEPGREYYDTVAKLRRMVEERLTHDPRVVEVLDENLAALDAAIAGYRDALASDPRNEALARRLAHARDRKVEVLRQAAELATEAAN